MQPHRVGRPHLGECGQYGERGRGGGCRSRAAVPREKTYKLSLRAAEVQMSTLRSTWLVDE